MTLTKRRGLEERFALLEDRVFSIELRLGPETARQVARSQPAPAIAESTTAELIQTAESAAVDPIETEIAHSAELAMQQAALAGSSPVLPIEISYASPEPASHAAIGGELERTIGLKWAGWIGAVVLVIGAAFGVKFIYDHHWFGQVPPAVWLSLIFIAGLSLIGVGEVIYRRVHVIPAASVFGAGVATLFLAGYVGHAYYDLYSPGTALFLMAAAALAGALVAKRGNLVSIAVLSHVGANLAPLLVGSRSAPLESFLVYLLALQMVALTLASWGRGNKWWTLRGLSLASTAIWIAGTGFVPGDESLVLFFSVVYAVLYHAELILAGMREREDHPAVLADRDSVAFCLIVTALLTVVVLWATRILPAGERSLIILTMAAVSAATGFGLSFFLIDAPAALKKIGTTHRVAAAALVALAVPVAFSGVGTDFAWGMLAVAFAASAAKTGSKISRTAGIVTWGLAVAHLAVGTVLLPEFGGHRATIWFSLFGTVITHDAIVALVLSVLGQLIAGLDRPRQKPTDRQANRSALVLSSTATAVWVVASILTLPPLAATAWIIEYAWLLVAAEALAPQLQFSAQAAALILLAAAKWAAVDTLGDRLSDDWSALTYHVLFNPMLGIGMLVSASIVTLSAIRGQTIWRAIREEVEFPAKAIRTAIGLIVTAILLWSITLEVDRLIEQMHAAGTLHWPLWQAKQLAWTIAWTIAAAGAFAFLRWRDADALPTAQWQNWMPQVCCALAIKFLTIDTLLWRVLFPPANVTLIVNLEACAGAVVLAALVMLFVLGLPVAKHAEEIKLRRMVSLLGALILLWTGSIEIDRYFAASVVFNGAVRPEQVLLSIFWSIFAVACVLLGFRVRAAELRFFGLGLLAVTLLKVVLIDMSQVQAGYRILSFMGLGALMLGTSVLYGKLGPRLLREDEEEESQMSIG